MGQRFLKEGPGWRLGWDENATHYQGLLAGRGWAVELTAEEFHDFCRLAQQLAAQLMAIATELMDDERITCEAESAVIWLEADGFPDRYGLRFIVQSGRRCEGLWPEDVAGEVVQAIDHLRVF